jgi:hypothetical protein
MAPGPGFPPPICGRPGYMAAGFVFQPAISRLIFNGDSDCPSSETRSICLYLNRNGLSAYAIHDELVQVLGSDAIALSRVTFYLRASHWTAGKEEQHSDPLATMSTTQFSRNLIKPHQRQ